MTKPSRSIKSIGGLAVFSLIFLVVAGLVAILGVSVVKAVLQYREAKQTTVTESNLTSPELAKRASMQQDSGDLVGATESLSKALAKDESFELRSQLAVLLYRQKKYQEAIAKYQDLLNLGKDKAFAWNGMGNAYRDWALQDTARTDESNTKAVEAYKEAIKADKGYVAAYVNLAILEKDLGQLEAAKQTASQGFAATGRAELKPFMQ